MNDTLKENRYQELDALRGIAALMVVFFHYTLNRIEASYGFKLGTTGVDLFFMISGFVIFMSINKTKTSKNFIISRLSRLYPTYWSCVTITFIVISIHSYFDKTTISFIQYIGNLTMFQFYLGLKDLDGPYWTLTIELFFYISILLLFHFKKMDYLKAIGLFLSILIVVLTSFFNNRTIELVLYYIPFLQFTPLFLAGIVFYKLNTEKTKLIHNYFIILICLINQIALFNFSGRSLVFISHTEYAFMLTAYFLLFTLFVNGKLKYIISPVTLFFGKISYALYLLHQYISIDFIIPYLTTKYHAHYWVAAMLVAFPVVVGLATAITYSIEIPFNKKIKERLGKVNTTKALF